MKEIKRSTKEKARAQKIISELRGLFPNAKIALNYSNDWELLVAVILSAQCTDKKVNEVTEKLFKKYPTLDSYVGASQAQFEQDIKSTGFYRNKAKNILGAVKMIQERFQGKIPKTMNEMLLIPGVARKTANVVLGNAYGVVEGIAVDTHVIRLSQLLGLTKEKTPEKIEKDLMALIPKDQWFEMTYLLISYGRAYCKGGPHHKHDNCPLRQYNMRRHRR